MLLKSSSIRKSIISRIVAKPQMGSVSKFWPREMKLAKELLSKYPDEIFWQSASFPGLVIKSLAIFKTKFGSDILDKKYKEFHFVPIASEPPRLPELSSRKFGEDLYNGIATKRSVSSFLKD